MKILLISDNYYPEVNALSNRSTAHSKFWSQNEEVVVLTCFPNHPKGELFYKYKKKKFYFKEVYKNLTVIRVWSYIAKKNNSYLNFLDYLSFGISSFIVSIFIRCDIVIGSSPPMPVAFFSILSAKIKGVKAILEVRDMWVESINQLKISKSKIILNLLYFIEILMFRLSDKIICVTPSIKNQIVKKGIDKKKIVVRENGYSQNEKFKKINIKLDKSKINIIYAGTIGFAQNFEIIFNIAKHFKKKIDLYLIGDGSQSSEIMEKLKSEKIKNVFLIKRNDNVMHKKLYQKFDYGVSCLKNNKVFKTVIPSKLYDYAANNLPIIFLGPKGEASKFIKKYSLGNSFNPNLSTLYENFSKIINKKKTSYDTSQRFQKLFTREKVAENILYDIKKS